MSTVLIVDDLQTDREILGKLVVATGNLPAYANDGEEALIKARQIHPALVLMDVVMPRLDGFNACRRLKKDSETAAIPVVLITLKATQSDEFWGRRQGADDYITKPFSAEQIKQVIRRFAS